MQQLILASIYLIFFLSGAAALMYEVVWVRSLSLIFGGSHLAVTTVLAVFMGGLALGSFLIGRRVGENRSLLRLYGLLEAGIAASAVLAAVLFYLYPSLYVPLAQINPESRVYLSCLRVIFAVVALIIPTTLMGGTLPVLSNVLSRRVKGLGVHISFLYGINTLGAVAGASAAAFILLRHFSLHATMGAAVTLNLVACCFSLLLQSKPDFFSDGREQAEEPPLSEAVPDSMISAQLPSRLVLWGIGLSGFCALSYEVLWTGVLSIAVGASSYGFAIMLIAFLSGIGAGSTAYGLASKTRTVRNMTVSRNAWFFGFVQIFIGIAALVVTIRIRSLADQALYLQRLFPVGPENGFHARQWAGLALAFSYLFVPAFFMGIAFPLAGRTHAFRVKPAGRAVGQVLAFNTIGGILGSAVSGFALLYLFGIERSLQLIIVLNLGLGSIVLFSTRKSLLPIFLAGGMTAVLIALLIFNPSAFRMWDPRFLATYLSTGDNTSRDLNRSLNLNQSAVLYYAEGAQAIVSSIRNKAGGQAFITNGRPEASNRNPDLQCQYTLGHLPMLLHKNPRTVFVLGAGSGMTLGATSVHPGVERITLAEIEPRVLGVTRTFAQYNHRVMENQKVRVVFNDGRNYLLTTKDKFDVITADPVHPWFSGAGSLYSAEYFKLAAQRLNPGGIICQWLPIYELSDANLRSVVKTFGAHFKYVMVWLTHYDAELIGSNSPIVIDREDLDRRIAQPEILRDLRSVHMGSSTDLLSYFLMGTEAARAYGREATLNTDENLYLEYSAPESMGNGALQAENCYTLTRYRQSIIPFLKPGNAPASGSRTADWAKREKNAVLFDQAHALYLGDQYRTAEFVSLMNALDALPVHYAPWEFLKEEYQEEMARDPKPVWQATLDVSDRGSKSENVRLAAVLSRMSRQYALVDIVDNGKREVFGTLEITGENREPEIKKVTDEIQMKIWTVYREEQKAARAQGVGLPSADRMMPRVKKVIATVIAEHESKESDFRTELNADSRR